MCRTWIWIPPCRSTEFNFRTSGFGSRVRICSRAHVYPVWSKVQSLSTQTCWQGARSVWFAVTVQEDDLLMMFLKCNRAQRGASFFPRLVPQRHQSLSCPLPPGDITNQNFRELLHESGRATLGVRGPPTTRNINDYCVEDFWKYQQKFLFIYFFANLLKFIKGNSTSTSWFAKSRAFSEDQVNAEFLGNN